MKQTKTEVKNTISNNTTSNKGGVRQQELAKAQLIMSNPMVAQKFFHEEMAPKLGKLTKSYKSNCLDLLNVKNICSISHLIFWENDWKKLRAFKGETSLKSWICMLTRQELTKRLSEENYINNLALESDIEDYDTFRNQIDDNGMTEDWETLHDILAETYNDPDSDKTIQLFLNEIAVKFNYSITETMIWWLKTCCKEKGQEIAKKLRVNLQFVYRRNTQIHNEIKPALKRWWAFKNRIKLAQ